MVSEDNIAKDRLIESWKDVANRIINSDKGHIVLLMHDRAFRSYDLAGSSIEQRSNELGLLLCYLKSKSIEFRTLDSYSFEEYR